MESKVFFLLFSIIIIIIILFVCEMHFHFERTRKKNIFTIENYSGWIIKCCCCCCANTRKKNKNQTHKNKQFESIEHFEIKQKKSKQIFLSKQEKKQKIHKHTNKIKKFTNKIVALLLDIEPEN